MAGRCARGVEVELAELLFLASLWVKERSLLRTQKPRLCGAVSTSYVCTMAGRCQAFPNGATIWELSVQTHKTVGSIS